MLKDTQFGLQHANPYVIKALTHTHGVYMNVYNKREMNDYDEGRDAYISNTSAYSSTPLYKMKKLLLYNPVQETFDSGLESFDSYIKDTYILTCDKSLVFEKEQKFEIFLRKTDKKPVRVMQCFEVHEISNVFNEWSIRKVMLKPFS